MFVTKARGERAMTSLQDLITKREALIAEVSGIEDRITYIVKQGEDFDIDTYCNIHRGDE